MSQDPAADATTGAAASPDVTALVLLRPPGGGTVGDEPISRQNLGRVTPDDDDVAEVATGLRSLGFEVGPMLGISMSITAPRSRFEAVLGVIVEPANGTWRTVGRREDRPEDPAEPSSSTGAGTRADDLVPIDALDASIARRIERIVFEPPQQLHEESSWTS